MGVSGRRYYSPSQGRFLGRDPIEEKGGLQLYGFCGNNSINLWDYLGMVDGTTVPYGAATLLTRPTGSTPDSNAIYYLGPVAAVTVAPVMLLVGADALVAVTIAAPSVVVSANNLGANSMAAMGSRPWGELGKVIWNTVSEWLDGFFRKRDSDEDSQGSKWSDLCEGA